MLSIKENEALTQVGPGTPMGELMRRYWHPIAATGELDDRPTKSVRLLGEDLVLYKDRSGTFGLLDRLCPHRRVDLCCSVINRVPARARSASARRSAACRSASRS